VRKTHRAFFWDYTTCRFSDLAAVVYVFSPSRAGECARAFLASWGGQLVCDDFGGYKASYELSSTKIRSVPHTRCKFFDLHAINKSKFAEKAWY
jgi:hypothetical protein